MVESLANIELPPPHQESGWDKLKESDEIND
jgi:hypothetical protein